MDIFTDTKFQEMQFKMYLNMKYSPKHFLKMRTKEVLQSIWPLLCPIYLFNKLLFHSADICKIISRLLILYNTALIHNIFERVLMERKTLPNEIGKKIKKNC